MGHLRTEMFITIFAIMAFALGVYFTKNFDKREDSRSREKQSLPTEISQMLPEHPSISLKEQFKSYNLTTREIEVLQELAKGSSNLEIASMLYLSESTVKTHVSNILFKLQAKRRTEVIRMVKEKL